MARLTDRFLEDLKGVGERERLVVFFDAIEKISLDTAKWIWGELLCAVRDGRLVNTIFVLCGQNKPELDRDWSYTVEMAQLGPLPHEYIVDYLARRGVEESQREVLATMLEATTQGRIAQIATAVDTFLMLQAQRKP
jgi:hypothetical protein